jgi:hypothetical protein
LVLGGQGEPDHVIKIDAHEPLDLLRVGVEIGQALLDRGTDEGERREVALMRGALRPILPEMFMAPILMHLLLLASS